VIVVDASIALAWCFEDEHDDRADAVLDMVAAQGAVAPGHWSLEVANGLLAAERRGRLSAEDTLRAQRLLADLAIEVVPVELGATTNGLLDVARAHGLTAYDAAYLDLAQFRGLALGTLDDDLVRACHAAGVALAA
jgi:predicted nucleic acid-binding protein